MSFEFVCRCMVVCYILCIRILIVCSIFVCIQEVTVYQSSYSVLYFVYASSCILHLMDDVMVPDSVDFI